MVIPKLISLATNTVVPQWALKEINKNLFYFIWDSKEKIKQTSMIRENKHGGLNAPDMASIFMIKIKVGRKNTGENNEHWFFT